MKKTFILFLLIIGMNSVWAQYVYTPKSVVSVDAAHLNLIELEAAINKMERPFIEKEIEYLKKAVDSCDQMVNRNLTKLENTCYELIQNKNALEQLRDVDKLKNDIKEKEDKIETLKKEALGQVLGIYYQSVYASVVDCSWKDDKDPLAEKSRMSTLAYAKEQLIDSVKYLISDIKGAKTITDYLLENITGKVVVDEQILSSKVDGQTKYVLISKVTFYPYEDPDQELKKDRKVRVSNLVPLFDVAKKLEEYNVPKEDLPEHKEVIDKKISLVKEYNFTTANTVKNVIAKQKDMYAVLYEDLINMKDHLNNREEHIERIITEKTTVSFDKENFEGSIDLALKYFEDQIELRISEMIQEKEKELLVSKYNVNVTLEGDPVESIAESAFSMAQQLEKLNYVISDFNDFTEENIVREIERIWVYPTAGNNDNFLLTVVAAFKVRRNVKSLSYPGLSTQIETRNFEYYQDPYSQRDYAFVKGGKFQMGSNEGEADEKPVHEVVLADFYIGKSEVTNKEYCRFLNDGGNKMEQDAWWLDITDEDCKIYKKDGSYYIEEGFEEHPVVEVTWYGANAFCRWLSMETGRVYRLPTEAEWEYAAQGGFLTTGLPYSGCKKPDDCAWYSDNSEGKPQRVCQKLANEIGAFDMSGNVWEWCSDKYSGTFYKISPVDNPQGAQKGYNRSIRGGAWFYDESYLRVTNRSSYSPDFSSVYIGFRVVLQK